jgi:cytosine/adenosine deaminase-related metal-dependent hydrolase
VAIQESEERMSDEVMVVRGGEVLDATGRLESADVLVAGGRIERVGGEMPADCATVDASGTIVAPGLINAHYHSNENFNPGRYENLPLDLWFVHSHQVTRVAPMSPEAIHTRTLLGAVQMLQSGTTAVVDFLFEAPEITIETLEPVVRAYRDAGLRATILLGVADKPFADSLPLAEGERSAAEREAAPPDVDRLMDVAREAFERFHEPDGLIGIGLGPSAPQRCTERLLDETAAFSREHGLVWQTHVQETRTQAVTAREWHDGTFVDFLAARNLLGPHATLVHTVWLTDGDMRRMAETGTAAVHCPFSNLRLGDGVANVPALRRAGVRVALGTDGRGCDETLDGLELTRLAALLPKARGLHFDQWTTASEALAMATREASPCTGHGEQLGRIEPGARADLMLLRRDTVTFTPLHDPIRQLVFGATSRDVRTVVVDGRVVVDDGEVAGVDMSRLLADASRFAAEELDAAVAEGSDAVEAAVRGAYERAERAPLDVHAYI